MHLLWLLCASMQLQCGATCSLAGRPDIGLTPQPFHQHVACGQVDFSRECPFESPRRTSSTGPSSAFRSRTQAHIILVLPDLKHSPHTAGLPSPGQTTLGPIHVRAAVSSQQTSTRRRHTRRTHSCAQPYSGRPSPRPAYPAHSALPASLPPNPSEHELGFLPVVLSKAHPANRGILINFTPTLARLTPDNCSPSSIPPATDLVRHLPYLLIYVFG
jgi:hypothetical protein